MSDLQSLDIEWKHLDVGGETCDRCSETIQGIRNIVKELKQDGILSGIKVTIRETLLPAGRIEESNQVLINGRLIEQILPVTIASTDCPSCACLTNEPSCCRAVVVEENVYEAIPESVIRSAILAVLAGD